MGKRFEVIALHPFTECNFDCPFCYKKRSNKMKQFKFWYELVPYLKDYTKQIALGGGEPFMYPEFIYPFSKYCKQNKIKLNITTNGKLLQDYKDFQIPIILKNVNMVSISIDNYKLTKWKSIEEINNLIGKLKRLSPKVIYGVNYLNLDNDFNKIKNNLDKLKNVDRFYLLTPKNRNVGDILKYKAIFLLLSKRYNLFVDDLTKQIMNEKRLKNWDKPCHYGKGIISIDEIGNVLGCSFDKKGFLKLRKPSDIKKIDKIKLNERYSCPYLMAKG